MKSPADIKNTYVTVARAKTAKPWYKTLLSAALAGAFIAFGAAVSTFASSGFSGAQASLIKGAVFPLGLILVVLCGAELFTGNCLLIAPTVDKNIKPTAMLKNLGLSYVGNLVGGVLVALLVVYSHAMTDTVAASAVGVGAAKCEMSFADGLLRGILCNMLVCLAVWSAFASDSAAGKIMALYLPVFAFVACGFEHSVANMYYLTAGGLAGAEYGISGMSFGGALLNGLLAPTLGNIIGGILIALALWISAKPRRTDGEAKKGD